MGTHDDDDDTLWRPAMIGMEHYTLRILEFAQRLSESHWRRTVALIAGCLYRTRRRDE